MKRCLSAPCLVEANRELKKSKSTEKAMEPNGKEYLQLALARILELQQEIKDGTYITQDGRNLGDSGSDEEILNEVLGKVFDDLPGTPKSVNSIIHAVAMEKQSQIAAIHGKRIQLLGYDTCRRAAVDFMKNTVRGTNHGSNSNSVDLNVGFRFGTYSRNEPKVAHRRTGLLTNEPQRRSASDHEIRMRMLKSLDLHLAGKQRDYTARLMRS